MILENADASLKGQNKTDDVTVADKLRQPFLSDPGTKVAMMPQQDLGVKTAMAQFPDANLLLPPGDHDPITDAARKELVQYGKEPYSLLTGLMKDNRVVGIGETHFPSSEEREDSKAIIQALARGGATHLAVEMPSWQQPLLDKFMATGELDRASMPPLLRDGGYVNALKTAVASGMKLVAVDADQAQAINQDRDNSMSGRIKAIVDADPKNKVVFWVGANHLERDGRDMCTRDGKCIDNAVTLLRRDLTVPTVFSPVDPHDQVMAPGVLQHELRRPVAVSTAEAKTIGSLNGGSATMDEWDYMLFYPQGINQDAVVA